MSDVNYVQVIPETFQCHCGWKIPEEDRDDLVAAESLVALHLLMAHGINPLPVVTWTGQEREAELQARIAALTLENERLREAPAQTLSQCEYKWRQPRRKWRQPRVRLHWNRK